jgi:uncharacterized membrane protein (DUF106 family)
MKPMMITLVVMLAVMMFYQPIGKALNYAFEPLIGFDGKYVVLTLILAGIIMTCISTIIRAYMTDMVKQTRNSRENSAFMSELRKARLENNLYKIKKLTAMQQQMMSKNMEGQASAMKSMPITMLIVIPIYAWIRYFAQDPAGAVMQAGTHLIHVPWGTWDIGEGASIWAIILIYTLITIPFGQFVSRMVRAYEFRKRLKELDEGTAT